VSKLHRQGTSVKLLQLGGLVLSVGIGFSAAYVLVKLSAGTSDQPRQTEIADRAPAPEPWVEPLVLHHSLYVANSLKHVEVDLDSVLVQLRKITDSTRLRTALPDLGAEGYTVKHVQELGFAGQPLVHLLYTRSDELPLAISVLPARGDPDRDLRLDRYHGLGTASWIENNQRFVLVADEPRDKLLQLYRITRGVFPSA